ncbi:MAG: hypothetical protein ACI85O_003739 [Saprospiraceae bacterium]|jgi:hypothetical protein
MRNITIAIEQDSLSSQTRNMKNQFFLFLFLLLAGHICAQDQVFWSERTDVNETGDDSPRLVLLDDGSPFIVWGHNSNIFFSKLVNDSFTTPTEIPTGDISPDIYFFGGIDVASHGDNIFVVFEDFLDGVFVVHSTDAGETFSAPVNAYDPVSGLWATLPSIIVDDSGNPIVSVILETSSETDAGYIVIRSTDGGISYETPAAASTHADGTFVCECCPSDMYSEGGNLWLNFRNNNNNLRDMWVSKSVDGGSNFDIATDVDETDWILNACPISGPKMAKMNEDSLISVWMSGADDGTKVYFSTLHSEEMVKGQEVHLILSNQNGAQNRPDVAAQNDTIGIVWEESGFGTNSTDLVFAFSTGGTQNLTSNTFNITQEVGAQKMPSLAYQDGIFHLAYTSAGDVKYRRGNVGGLNAVQNPVLNTLPVEIINRPVTGEYLKLRFKEHIAGELNLQLTDAVGRVVLQENFRVSSRGEMKEIRTGNLSAGQYFLTLRAKSGYFAAGIPVK